MRICAVIMAGGLETRFGPISKYLGGKPTQKINGREGILVETILRCKSIINIEDTFIVTSKEQKLIYDEILNYTNSEAKNYFNEKNYIIEPEPKNTAPCILFSAFSLKHRYQNEETIMCVFPSDHDIPNDDRNMELFQSALNTAIEAAGPSRLITIGLEPEFAAKAYGYIAYEKKQDESCHKVIAFEEKPKTERRAELLKAAGRLWNSGIFVWRTDSILEKFKKSYADWYFDFCKIYDISIIDTSKREEYKNEAYSRVEKISVDYAILELPDAVKDIYVVVGKFKWQDIGKWDALLAVFSKKERVIDIDLIGVDLGNNSIYSTGKLLYKSNQDYSFNFDADSILWLYCETNKMSQVQKMLKDYDYYENYFFNTIKVDELQMQVAQKEILEFEFKRNEELKSRLSKYIDKKANRNFNFLVMIILLGICAIAYITLVWQKTVISDLALIITILSVPMFIIELLFPKLRTKMPMRNLRNRYMANYKKKEFYFLYE